MAKYDRMTVAEITIMVIMTKTEWRDTLNGRVIEAAWYDKWRPKLWRARQQVYTVHVWMKHGVIHTCTQNSHVRNKV